MRIRGVYGPWMMYHGEGGWSGGLDTPPAGALWRGVLCL